MKRDMDLVRKILIVMSESSLVTSAEWETALPDYTREEIFHHAHLMDQGGLVIARDVTYQEDRLPMGLPLSITWDGHEFLGAMRDPSLWEKARTTVLNPAGGAAFGVLLEWAKAQALRVLNDEASHAGDSYVT